MRRFLLIAILGLLGPGIVLAATPAAADWSALDQPGAFAIMRHALAPGTGDPADFAVDDCTTQRNLDDRGRAQAAAIGDAFRDRGIAFDTVLTSQWCRCIDTADLLALAPVVEEPAFNSFFQDRSQRDARTAAALDVIDGLERRVMIVTHYVNILALTGETTRSGEVLIVRRGNGGLDVLGRILLAP